MKARYDYEHCLRRSERVDWKLADAVAGLDFDFSKPFLPERIAATAALRCLSDDERLRLNQIRGHSYAHLFLFVEEFIIPQVADLARSHVHVDPVAARALLRFSEEELKHQELFRAVKTAFREGFGRECAVIDGQVETARTVCQFPAMSVMLLTSMLEWITQRHYLECFRGASLDASFSEVFRLHWVEEAQHAKLDTLELQRLAGEHGADHGNESAAHLLELCEAIDALLASQVDLDLEALRETTGRRLRAAELDEARQVQLASYRWTFFVSGLDHPVFQQLVCDLAPRGREHLDTALRRYS